MPTRYCRRGGGIARLDSRPVPSEDHGPALTGAIAAIAAFVLLSSITSATLWRRRE